MLDTTKKRGLRAEELGRKTIERFSAEEKVKTPMVLPPGLYRYDG
jgi:hypothetical protein